MVSRKPSILLLMSAECSMIFTATMAPFQRPAQGFRFNTRCASKHLAFVWGWELMGAREVDPSRLHIMGWATLQGRYGCMLQGGQLPLYSRSCDSQQGIMEDLLRCFQHQAQESIARQMLLH